MADVLVVELKNQPEVSPTVWFLYSVAAVTAEMVVNRRSAVRYGVIGCGDLLGICERRCCDLVKTVDKIRLQM